MVELTRAPPTNQLTRTLHHPSYLGFSIPKGFQGTQIPVHASNVTKLIKDRVEGDVLSGLLRIDLILKFYFVLLDEL